MMTAASPPPDDRPTIKISAVPRVDLSPSNIHRSDSFRSTGTETPSASRLVNCRKDEIIAFLREVSHSKRKLVHKMKELQSEQESVQISNFQFEHILRQCVGRQAAQVEHLEIAVERERRELLSEKKRRYREQNRRKRLEAQMKDYRHTIESLTDIANSAQQYLLTAEAMILSTLNQKADARQANPHPDQSPSMTQLSRNIWKLRQQHAEGSPPGGEGADHVAIGVRAFRDLQTTLDVIGHAFSVDQPREVDASSTVASFSVGGDSSTESSSTYASGMSRPRVRVYRLLRQLERRLRERNRRSPHGGGSTELQLSSSAEHLDDGVGGSQTFTLPSISDSEAFRDEGENTTSQILVNFHTPCHYKATQFPSPKGKGTGAANDSERHQSSTMDCSAFSEPREPEQSYSNSQPSPRSSKKSLETSPVVPESGGPNVLRPVSLSFSPIASPSTPKLSHTLTQPPRRDDRCRFSRMPHEAKPGCSSPAPHPKETPSFASRPLACPRVLREMTECISESESSQERPLLKRNDKPGAGWQAFTRAPLSLTRPKRLARFFRAPLDTPRGAAVMVVCSTAASARPTAHMSHERSFSDGGQSRQAGATPVDGEQGATAAGSGKQALQWPRSLGMRRTLQPQMQTMPWCHPSCIHPAPRSIRFPPLARFTPLIPPRLSDNDSISIS